GRQHRVVLEERLPPAEREASPHGHEPQIVERVDDHQADRQIEEGVAEHEDREGKARLAVHDPRSRLLACCRWDSAIGPTSRISRTIATADASGQSELVKNSSHSTLPIISVLVPPSRSGITNSPTAGMNTSRQPAMIPGRESGSVTVKNAAAGFAPR